MCRKASKNCQLDIVIITMKMCIRDRIGRDKDKLNNVTDELINNAKTEYSKDIVVKWYSCNVIDKEELNKTYEIDRKSTRLNSSHITRSRMPSSA